MFEQILFISMSITIFGLIFYKMIKTNETIYIYILTLQALGIITRGAGLIFSIEFGILPKTIIYVISIIIPLIILLL